MVCRCPLDARRKFHLTLRFIGDVDEGVADDVDGALLEIDVPPFDVFIAGIGYFGKAKLRGQYRLVSKRVNR